MAGSQDSFSPDPPDFISSMQAASSKWYRPPTPTFYDDVAEDIDALTLEDLDREGEYDSGVDALAAWSPAVYAVQDDSDDELAEHFDVDEEDMHAAGIPAARGWRLDARYVRIHI